MKREITNLSIAFVGDMNPAIFQPSWLAQQELIQESESEAAKIEIIHNEIAQFSLDWVTFEITRGKFQIKTSKAASFNICKDLAVSIFTVLGHTPLKGLGINHIFHYSFTEEEYYKIGKVLAPFENWEGVLNDPRLLDLSMKEEKRIDGQEGHYLIRIAPSERIQQFGVSININSHFGKKDYIPRGSNKMVQILNENWERACERANNIPERLWKNLGI